MNRFIYFLKTSNFFYGLFGWLSVGIVQSLSDKLVFPVIEFIAGCFVFVEFFFEFELVA